MRLKKMKKAVLCAVLSVSLLLACAVTPPVDVFARTLEEIQAEQDALETEKAELDKKLEELQKDIDKQEEYLKTVEEQQNNLKSQIDGLNQQIRAYDEQIAEIESGIADTRTEINEKTNILKERLKAIYLMGEASTLEILLNCDSLIDFSEKTEILKAISNHDLELISELKATIDEVEDDIKAIETYKNSVSESKKALEKKSLELSALFEEASKLREELGLSHEELHGEQYDIETQMENNQAEIDEILNPPSYSGGSSSSEYVGTGTFIWPLPGYYYLTSYWGDGRNHKGIDIAEAGVYGAPVVAADSGVVTWAVHDGWGGGYGLSVWIDHGNGYSTRYAHFSYTAVNYGDYVEQGQIIGYVGDTGDSYGAHLHYEIRYYDVAYDPMQWYS